MMGFMVHDSENRADTVLEHIAEILKLADKPTSTAGEVTGDDTLDTTPVDESVSHSHDDVVCKDEHVPGNFITLPLCQYFFGV